jgi:hypothetical protein
MTDDPAKKKPDAKLVSVQHHERTYLLQWLLQQRPALDRRIAELAVSKLYEDVHDIRRPAVETYLLSFVDTWLSQKPPN